MMNLITQYGLCRLLLVLGLGLVILYSFYSISLPLPVTTYEPPAELTLYLLSSGWTAMAVSPSIVSTRVVATTISSPESEWKGKKQSLRRYICKYTHVE